MRLVFLISFLCVVVIITLERCVGPNNAKKDEDLARSVCGSCHEFPEPSAFPKDHWESQIFPSMAKFMGMYATEFSRDSLFETGEGGERVQKANVFPENPLVSVDDWNAIRNYYLSNAPKELTISAYSPIINTDLFRPEVPVRIKGFPSTSLVKYIENGNFIYGDAGAGTFIEFDPGFSTRKMGQLEEAPVHFIRKKDDDIVTVMGSFSPMDAALGMLVKLPRKNGGLPAVLIDKLQRPVHANAMDLDKDGYEDYVICEFGKYTGALSIHFSNKTTGFKKINVSTTPGAIRTEIIDMNSDGLMDVVALFGQANERIELFINQGKRDFTAIKLLGFPPYNGSSSFQMMDIDSDGDQDIIYTAGDNADLYPIIKPYHGIYFFENTGDLKFKQKIFLPMPGAYAAQLYDFDLDGIKDLIGVSFFPDWTRNTPLDCLFWKGTQNGFLQPEQISLSNLGRWIVSDAGDFDNDGDTDLILGSLMLEAKPDRGHMQRWMEEKIPFLILRNQTK